MDHIYIVPYGLQNILSMSSHRIFEQLGELRIISFPFTKQLKELQNLFRIRWLVDDTDGQMVPKSRCLCF